MAFNLLKVETFIHPCALQQTEESGKTFESKLRVRFKKISREAWEALQSSQDDDRLMYDVAVVKFEDDIEVEGGDKLTGPEAVAAIREDLSLAAQIVDQYIEVQFGVAAKNARRSRGR